MVSKRKVLYNSRVGSGHPEWAAREWARLLGARGGRARMKKLTTEQRRALAAKGGKASKGAKNGRKKKAKKKKK